MTYAAADLHIFWGKRPKKRGEYLACAISYVVRGIVGFQSPIV
jgi:hypothetical protein